jgi:hypothetical protein
MINSMGRGLNFLMMYRVDQSVLVIIVQPS